MMDERENYADDVEETIDEVVEESSDQPEEKPQEAKIEQPAPVREDHPNFKQIRKQNQELFERNKQLEQALSRLEQKITEDADQFEDPETLRVKKLELKLQQLEKKEQQQQLEQKLLEQVQEAHETLGDIYDDFGIVYSKSNINDFYDKYPSIERRAQQKARTLGYEEAAEYVYKCMKEKGYGKKQIDEAVKEVRVAKNAQKPQHASIMGQVAAAQHENTLEYKAKLRAETDRIIKGY